MLSTVFALISVLGALAALGFMWLASKAARDAHVEAAALTTAIRVNKVNMERLNALEGRLDRVSGRIYAQTRRAAPGPVQAPDEAAAQGSDPSYAGPDQLDPDLAAEIALAAAPSAAPGRR